jgi:hypothetical protein
MRERQFEAAAENTALRADLEESTQRQRDKAAALRKNAELLEELERKVEALKAVAALRPR